MILDTAIVNDLKYYLGAAQSVAITIAFLYLTWKIPILWSAWLDHRKEVSTIEMVEQKAEREARQENTLRIQEFIKAIFASYEKLIDRLISKTENARPS